MRLTKRGEKARKNATKRAYELLSNKQITTYLAKVIIEANYDNETYIKELHLLCEDLMRVRGYYRSKVRIDLCNQCVKEWLILHQA